MRNLIIHADAHSHAVTCMHTTLVKLVVAFFMEIKFKIKIMFDANVACMVNE